MERGVPEEIFRNRRTTFGAAPLFSLQPIGTETCRSICTTARFFPPFPMSCERALTDLPVKMLFLTNEPAKKTEINILTARDTTGPGY